MHKDIVDSIPFFKSKPSSFIAHIGNLLKPIRVNKNDYIFMEGDPADEMFFIKSGKVAAVLSQFNNFKFLKVKAGYFFGELDLLFYNEIRKYTFMATKDSELLVLSKKQFKNVFLIDFRDIGMEFIRNAYLRKHRTRKTYKDAIEFCKTNYEEQNKPDEAEEKEDNKQKSDEKIEEQKKVLKERNYKTRESIFVQVPKKINNDEKVIEDKFIDGDHKLEKEGEASGESEDNSSERKKKKSGRFRTSEIKIKTGENLLESENKQDEDHPEYKGPEQQELYKKPGSSIFKREHDEEEKKEGDRSENPAAGADLSDKSIQIFNLMMEKNKLKKLSIPMSIPEKKSNESAFDKEQEERINVLEKRMEKFEEYVAKLLELARSLQQRNAFPQTLNPNNETQSSCGTSPSDGNQTNNNNATPVKSTFSTSVDLISKKTQGNENGDREDKKLGSGKNEMENTGDQQTANAMTKTGRASGSFKLVLHPRDQTKPIVENEEEDSPNKYQKKNAEVSSKATTRIDSQGKETDNKVGDYHENASSSNESKNSLAEEIKFKTLNKEIHIHYDRKGKELGGEEYLEEHMSGSDTNKKGSIGILDEETGSLLRDYQDNLNSSRQLKKDNSYHTIENAKFIADMAPNK